MSTRAPAGDGTAPPPDFPEGDPVAEGPMRRELRRQIARLERELTHMKAVVSPWEMRRVNGTRGPALLRTEALEQVRDELLKAHRMLERRMRSSGR